MRKVHTKWKDGFNKGGTGINVSLSGMVKREILSAIARGPTPAEVAIFKHQAKDRAVADGRRRAHEAALEATDKARHAAGMAKLIQATRAKVVPSA